MPNAIDVTSPEFQMFLEHLNTNFPARAQDVVRDAGGTSAMYNAMSDALKTPLEQP